MSFPGPAKALGFILTANRPRAVAFYRDVMGFALLAEDTFAATFDMGGLTVRLSDVDGHSPTPHPVLGWTVPDIRASVATLAARGITFTIYDGYGQDAQGIWTAPDGATHVAWFPDADGNLLSLTQTG
jgi:catechol 2,3-dioxygenase-like lactoylglutathione lyase family enzyme